MKLLKWIRVGSGITSASPGPFSNVGFGAYFSSTDSPSDSSYAMSVAFNNGSIVGSGKGGSLFAWAVYDGDVAAVPLPAAVWLFCSGLLGLVGIARRKKAA